MDPVKYILGKPCKCKQHKKKKHYDEHEDCEVEWSHLTEK